MKYKNTEEALRKFAQHVIFEARKNLKDKDKNVSSKLSESITYKTKEFPNSFFLSFSMEEYGWYQDRGVRGTKSGRSLDNFRYKKSSNLVGLEAATGIFAAWARSRGLFKAGKFDQPRTRKGRFQGYATLGYILANSIKKKGIKPSMFFTKPFEKAFKDLPDALIESYGLDAENLIQYIRK
jgi:hypothetical protein